MADDHFSRETLLRFFRSQLSRGECRGFVRHLLRQCPRCEAMLREVSDSRDFCLLFRAVERTALRADDGRTQDGIASSSGRTPWIRTSMG